MTSLVAPEAATYVVTSLDPNIEEIEKKRSE
jgi:hypothetical protein